MKKGASLFFLVLFVFAASASPALAASQDRLHKFEAALRASSMVLDDGDLSNSFQLDGGFDYGVAPWLAVGVSAGWAEGDFETSVGTTGNRIQGGDLTITPVFLDFIFRSQDRSRPYALYGVLGLGYIFSSVDEETAMAANNLHAEEDDDFAFKLGIGLDWFLNDRWAANVELARVFTGANIKVSNLTTGADIDDRELDYWYVGGGVKYLFS